VWQAIERAAGGPVAEGNVGAGTGTCCFGFKGGIGSASRRALGFTVGALVQSNFGSREDLTVLGVPVGQHLADTHKPEVGPGSIMMVLATDAPLTSRQLERLAKRAAFGLARTGSVCAQGSGDFVIAFSTAYRIPRASKRATGTMPRFNDSAITPIFRAAIESIEEAVLNSLVAAETMTGRDGNTAHALPLDRLADLLERFNRASG
jgi:D-aminopeptidase